MLLKRFKITYIFIVFVLWSTYSIANEALNYTDDNNQKQGHWVFTNKVKKLPNYKEDQIVEEGDYLNNKKNGKWLFYYNNDKVKHILTFSNNRPDGYAIFYYKNGQKREEGVWKNNKWVGDYKYYYENGNVRFEWQYNQNGQRTGIQKYYHLNGQLMIEGEWNNGKESGTITEYYEDGSIKSERIFNNGQLDLESTKNFKPQEKVVVKINEVSDQLPLSKELKKDSITELTVLPTEVKKVKAPWNGTGNHQFFNKKGQLVREGYFIKGYLMDGNVYMYNVKGEKIRTTVFKGGRLIQDINHAKN